MPLTVLFSISQLSLLSKYAPPNEPKHVPPIVVES
jgi:intracellular septation protein